MGPSVSPPPNAPLTLVQARAGRYVGLTALVPVTASRTCWPPAASISSSQRQLHAHRRPDRRALVGGIHQLGPEIPDGMLMQITMPALPLSRSFRSATLASESVCGPTVPSADRLTVKDARLRTKKRSSFLTDLNPRVTVVSTSTACKPGLRKVMSGDWPIRARDGAGPVNATLSERSGRPCRPRWRAGAGAPRHQASGASAVPPERRKGFDELLRPQDVRRGADNSCFRTDPPRRPPRRRTTGGRVHRAVAIRLRAVRA